jgi:rare lipoprotein A (peptidoglycan hydrolase)
MAAACVSSSPRFKGIGCCIILLLLALAAQSCTTVSPLNRQTALPELAPPAKPVPALNGGKTLSDNAPADATVKRIQRGEASWYGPGFQGKKTAAGDSFDPKELTAAHQTFPLGSKVKVTNLSNGKTAEVEIKDRGPFVAGRIIDVSKAAAEKLGMIASGTVPVQIELLSDSGSGAAARASKD